MTSPEIVVGVISDTHGKMRASALEALRAAGVARIVHAGDVGNPSVLQALERIAPVTAVAGNTDHGWLAARLSETEVLETDHGTIYVLHDLGQLDLDPAAAGFSVVVSGHTHRPANDVEDGVRYLNPGSAGPRRYEHLMPSVAILRMRVNGTVSAEIVDLTE